MVEDVLKNSEEKMKKTLDSLKRDFQSLRAGRATPALLDKIMVDYYGTPTPINQVAKVSVPESRLIIIQPWEKPMIKEIEKAIMKSDLGLAPSSDGVQIRLGIPPLTQERRAELAKTINKKSEDAKVALRNIRRDANDSIKKLEKSKQITEDDMEKGQKDAQKVIDKYIKLVDEAKAAKEKEIMAV